MSPAANKTVYNKAGLLGVTCKKGWLCVDVWDPTKKTYKVFEMYTCTTRNLSYFSTKGGGDGLINDNQTGHVTTYFTKKNNSREGAVKVKAPGGGSIDWDPIWHIQVC